MMNKSRIGIIIVLIIFCMIASSMPAAPSFDYNSRAQRFSDYYIESSTTTVFEVSFTQPGYRIVNVSMPKDAVIKNASFSITNLSAIENPALDFGDDGEINWKFNGTMGIEKLFENGENTTLYFEGEDEKTAYFTIPKSVIITHSSMRITINVTSSKYEYDLRIGESFWHQSTDEPFRDGYEIGDCPVGISSIKLENISDDELPEIIIGTGDGVYVLANGDGMFMEPEHIFANSTNSVAVVDIDNDGDNDIVCGGDSGKIYILNNNNNVWADTIIQTSSTKNMLVAVYDLDNDSAIGIVAGDTNGVLYIVEKENENFVVVSSFPTGLSPLYSAAWGYINEDGFLDIICVGKTGPSNVVVCLKNDTGYNVTQPRYVHLYASSADVGDINNDDRDDIIVVGRMIETVNGVIIKSVNAGNTSFVDYPITCEPVWSYQYAVSVGDVDGDGIQDIVSVGENQKMYYVLNNGTSCKSVSISNSGNKHGIALGDIDGDGDLDAVCGDSNGKIWLCRNTVKTELELVEFTSVLNNYISTCGNTSNDPYGNTFCFIPLNISSKYPGNITLSNLSIVYNYTANVPNTADIIKTYLETHQQDAVGWNLTIPLNFSADSAGKLLVAINISYLIPPRLVNNIPSTYSFDEDNNTQGCNLINLEEYFWDEKDDGELGFTVVYLSNYNNVNAVINDSYLTMKTLTQDWNGNVTVRVRAKDSDDLKTESNNFVVTINPVNDPPRYIKSLKNSTIGKGRPWNENLNDYFKDPESSVLSYTCNYDEINIADSNASWAPSGGDKILSNVTFTAFDGEHNTISYPITLTYYDHPAPAYTGGLEDASVIEDTTWSVDLNDYFTFSEFGVTFECSSDYITVLNNIASWTPLDDSHSLTNVMFTAKDNKEPNLTGSSSPINLTFIWVNDRPYLKKPFPSNDTVYENKEWSIDLKDYFTDEEKPDEMRIICSSDKITIDQAEKTASWTPKKGDSNITIIFTAVDADNSSLTVSSGNITLIFMGKNDPPVASIVNPKKSKTIREGDTIIFEGNGTDDGSVVAYEWTSGLDGYLSNSASFSISNLSVGKHAIRFRCQDNTGKWSETVEITVTVLESKESIYARFMPYFMLSFFLIIIGVAVNLIGRRFISE